jgi:hypothetical protein
MSASNNFDSSHSTSSSVANAAEPPEPKLSTVQVAASALAAVTATVVASFFGVAGTLIGAALASVVTVIGNAIYTHSLRRTHDKMRELVPVGWEAGARLRRVSASRAADPAPAAAPPRDPGTPAWLRLNWRRLALATAALFLIIIGAITAFEAIAGRPVADVVRGRAGTGTSVFGGTNATTAPPTRTPAPSSSITSARESNTSSNTPTSTAPASTSAAPQSSAAESAAPSSAAASTSPSP